MNDSADRRILKEDVDDFGNQLETFDVFNAQWRSTQWKGYLQDVAKTYGGEPAMSGYVFDDSFGSGNISYGAYEEKLFGSPLPRLALRSRHWAPLLMFVARKSV